MLIRQYFLKGTGRKNPHFFHLIFRPNRPLLTPCKIAAPGADPQRGLER
jgi:hypothetical protein